MAYFAGSKPLRGETQQAFQTIFSHVDFLDKFLNSRPEGIGNDSFAFDTFANWHELYDLKNASVDSKTSLRFLLFIHFAYQLSISLVARCYKRIEMIRPNSISKSKPLKSFFQVMKRHFRLRNPNSCRSWLGDQDWVTNLEIRRQFIHIWNWTYLDYYEPLRSLFGIYSRTMIK